MSIIVPCSGEQITVKYRDGRQARSVTDGLVYTADSPSRLARWEIDMATAACNDLLAGS
jgi:hypothetical protein